MPKGSFTTVITIACTITMLLLSAWPASLARFEFSPEFITQQPWRWWTAHLVHLNPTHLLGNLVAFIALVVIFAPVWRRSTLLWVLLVSASGASAAVWAAPAMITFAGLSGALHGLALFGILQQVPQQRWYLLALLVLAAKLSLEAYYVVTALAPNAAEPLFFANQSVVTHSWLGAPTAYLAHLGGAAGGLLCWAFACFYTAWCKKRGAK